MTRRSDLLMAAAAVLAMTVFVTWPQALYMSTRVAAHQDPEFSIWRLGWIAHALATSPRHLLDGNIFYPLPNTLTFSDATLVEGAFAAPLFWLKLSPILIYNIMLLGGIAASGLAVFVLVRELTSRTAPALYAAAVFTMAPYRIEHFMHLELQWAMWIPLMFWALHRTLRTGEVKYGALAGLFFALQIASCVYYGVFLALALAVWAVVESFVNYRRVRAAVPRLAIGAIVASALTAPYLWAYLKSARMLGPRDISEIAVYSARPLSYFASPPQNMLWGWSELGPELNLFLGWSVMTVALIGVLFYRSATKRVVYGAIAAGAIWLSFGLSSPLYRALLQAVPVLQGLRSPSRFAIITSFAIATLGGFGIHVLSEWAESRRTIWIRAAVPLCFALVFVEYANQGMFLMNIGSERPSSAGVYKVMKSIGPGALVELPMPTPGTLPGSDTDYEMWSLVHWQPLVNGYSGYYPNSYIETLARMETFPDDESIARLQRLGVRYVIVHCGMYLQADGQNLCPPLLINMALRPELRPYGKYTDPIGAPAYLFTVKQ